MSLVAPALLSYTYLPLTGPRAAAAEGQLRLLWRRIRDDLGLDVPIDGLAVPADLPEVLGYGDSRLLAACERRTDDAWQAAVRVEYDVLCLIMMLAPPRSTDTAATWRDLEQRLAGISDGADAVIGAARLFLALTEDAADVELVRGAAPSPAVVGWTRVHDQFAVDGQLATLWELVASPDDRPVRRLIVIAHSTRERELDHLVWSTGDGMLPPFGRYLLHAARLRYQIRVFDGGRGGERIRTRLSELEDDLTGAAAELAQLRQAADTVRVRVIRMRRAVDVLARNLREALQDAGYIDGHGPVSDDLALVTWFTDRLNDEAELLAETGSRARLLSGSTGGLALRARTATPAVDAVGPDRPPLVFISYIHDSHQHKEAVRRLAIFLREHGIDAQLDQWFDGRRQDWYQWMLAMITRADFVIVVASPLCHVVGDGQISDHLNLGGQSEMAALRELLQRDRVEWTPKLLPVVLPGRDWREIPLFLQGSTADHYQVDDFTVAGAEDLLRAITEQPSTPPPPIGPRLTFPS
jgi:hypothetical protein